jgi:hypothetical protein
VVGPINNELLHEAIVTARSDGDLISLYQEGALPIREVAKLVSRDIWSIRRRRLFDELFYEPQLEAVMEQLGEHPEYQPRLTEQTLNE